MRQIRVKEFLFAVLLGFVIWLIPINSHAAEVTVGWNSENVIVTNNVGKPDTVKVNGLPAGATIKIYDKAIAGVLLGSGTVMPGLTEVTVPVKELGSEEGKVYVSVTLETSAVEIGFFAEVKSTAPTSNNITVMNNVGTTDTVKVTNVAEGDVVKVYKSGSTTAIGIATVAAGKTEVLVSITQLGSDEGTIEVTVTSKDKLESNKTEKAYSAELKSAAPAADNITVTNNAGISDTVKVTGLTVGDTVKVYRTGTTTPATATVGASATEVTLNIAQLSAEAGVVEVSVTSKGMLESSKTEKAYGAEAQSTALAVDNITVTNNVGTADIVKVTNTTEGDVVKVYKSGSATAIGTATVAAGKTEAPVSITQLGSDEGTIEVTVTSKGKLESSKTEKTYSAEVRSAAPAADNITVTNNAGISDTVKVTGLTAGDTVKVYRTGTTTPATATVGASATEVTLNIAQLSAEAGVVEVSVTSKGRLESSKTEKAYGAEAQSTALAVDNITVTNNVGTADIVKVTNVAEGDVVKVYKSGSATAIGTATVAAGKTEALVSITQLGSDEGTIEVTVTSKGKLESSKTEKTYSAEVRSAAPAADNITVTNNAGISDTVKVTGLTAGDIVKVYRTGTTTPATATVGASATEVTLNIAQLSAEAGVVEVSVTSKGRLESSKTEKAYGAEAQSTALAVDNITVSNYVGTADIVKVTNATEGDVVKVYKSGSATAIGTATVAAGKTEALVSITQLGSDEGTIEVTVTSKGKLESSKTAKTYSAEVRSAAPAVVNITVTNNVGKTDTVKVTGLVAGDIVKVYRTGTTTPATATVGASATEVTLNIAQLSAEAGVVQVSITSKGMLESSKTEKAYGAEPGF